MALLGRDDEQGELDQVVAAVREGLSRALVVRGEAGIGKSVLLDYFVDAARDLPVARLCGIESEMELGFAALHQLLQPYQETFDELPPPQRGALRCAFGLSDGDAPNPFLVGLAALTILADAATPDGLLVVVDDAQWLDQESAHALAFVARRIYADGIGMVLTVRQPSTRETYDGLPELMVDGLSDEAAANC